MSFDIQGWIEVTYSPDTREDLLWLGVVQLNSLVEVADADTELLFGLSRGHVTGQKLVDAIAAGRGLPENPSAEVSKAIKEIADHEAQFGPGEFGGYTFAVWREIRSVELTSPPSWSQMRLPFALARDLEAVFGPDRVRFVVWFCW